MNNDFAIEVNDTAVMEQLFEELPGRFQKKVIVDTFKKAAAPMRTAMRRELPGSIRKLSGRILKAKAGKSATQPSLTVGFFGKTGGYSSGKKKVIDLWFLTYWLNYGTLSKRHSGHKFVRARKKGTAGWKGGITPRLFVEKAVNGSVKQSEQLVYDSISEELRKVLQKLKR